MTFRDGYGQMDMLGGSVHMRNVTCAKDRNPLSGSINLTFSIRGSVGIETQTQEGAIWPEQSLIEGFIPQAQASGDAFKLYRCPSPETT